MSDTSKQMRLIGWLAAGPIAYHQGGWRYPSAEHGFLDPARVAEWAQMLERAKFDAVFFADGADFDREYAQRAHVHLVDLVPLASVIAHETTRIGIGITQNTTVNEPFNLARTIGTLDYVSKGRFAWNVVTGGSETEAGKYGKRLLPRAERYARAAEVVDAAKRLWDSMPSEAVVLDRRSGTFLDTELLEEFTFDGEYVSAVGPLPVPRSPQGGPVILQAGASPAGRALAAKYADVVFIMSKTAEQIRDGVRAVKEEAAKAGRDGKVLVIPAVTVIVAETSEMARQQWGLLNSLVNIDHAIDSASMLTGLDLRSYPSDMPVVELPENEAGSVGIVRLLKEAAEADELTLAEAAVAMTNSGIPLLLGNPDEVAAQLESLFAESEADGFMIHAPVIPGGFEDFARMVVPILQDRGVFRAEYEGETLRQNLFG
ncbi:MAG: NtaA/DmoA family FMN-dependent monooxygenase [Leucobacter sp.]